MGGSNGWEAERERVGEGASASSGSDGTNASIRIPSNANTSGVGERNVETVVENVVEHVRGIPITPVESDRSGTANTAVVVEPEPLESTQLSMTEMREARLRRFANKH